MVWVALLVCLFGGTMSTLLTRAKLADGLAQIIEARVLSGGRVLARSIERAQGIGLRLAELETLPALLARHRLADPLIRSIDVFEDGGRVMASSSPQRLGREIETAVRSVAQRSGEASWSTSGADGRVVGITLRTSFGLTIGHLALHYGDDELAPAMASADRELIGNALIFFGSAALLAGLATYLVLRRRGSDVELPLRALAAACLVPLVLALGGFGYTAQQAFEARLLPQAERKAAAVGAGLAGLFEQALAHGFEFRGLRGVEPAFAELRAANPEIDYVVALDAAGGVVFRDGVVPAGIGLRTVSDGQARVALDQGPSRQGELVLGVDPRFVRGLLLDMGFDVGVVLLVALVLAGELARHVIFGGNSQVETRLVKLRAPLFAFILAEELTRPCLPAYIGRLAAEVGGKAPPLVVGLPIALFMLIVALGQPGLGRWSERVGRRQALLAGALVAAVGFAGTALAQGLWDLLGWRSLSALGYALVFAAGQGYVLDHAGPGGRTRGFAMFVGAIMAATVCGPSIGGLLADHLGQRATFGLSALLCLLATVPMRALPSRSEQPRTAPRPKLGELAHLLGNRRFAALTLFAAIPAKVLLIGGLFYLVPLYVAELGYGQAVGGRLIMLYGLLMVALVPLLARYGERTARRVALVGAGLAVSAAGGLALMALPQLGGLVALVALLGVGQALSISAQAALVGEFGAEEIARCGQDAVYGAYRLLERLGNAAGPLIAGVLLGATGFAGAFSILAVAGIVCALAFRYTLSADHSLGLGNARA